MSDYNLQIAWSGKDSLADSDPDKVVSGGDFNTEFLAVKTAVNSKANLAGSATQAFAATTASAGPNTPQVATTHFTTSAGKTKIIAETGAGSNGYGTRTISTGAASGGSDGDIHYQVS